MSGVLVAVVGASFTAILRGQTLHLTPLICPASIQTIGNCPEEGCGGVSDALLNKAKNRTDAPTTAPPIFHVHHVVDLNEPADWLTGQDRDSIAETEGKPVRLMAFLKVVKTETSGETCNCN